MIKYLHLKVLTPNQVSFDMKKVLGNNTPLQATIYRWIAEFQRGWQSISCCPVDTCTDDDVKL